MKIRFLLGALLVCAAPAWAQPDPKPANGLPFPLVSPAEAQRLAMAGPIRLNLRNVTLRAALDELQKQSGVALDYSRGAPTETLDKILSVFIETPSLRRAFLEIMDEAGVKASLQLYGYDINQPWRIAFGQTEREQGVFQTGDELFAARLQSLSATLSKTVDLNDINAPRRREENWLNVNLKLLPDPRLPLVGLPQALVKRAEDDQGRSLLAKEDAPRINGYSFYSNGGWRQSQTALRLRPPESDAKTLAHLEGAIVYALVTRREKWEVPDLLAAKEWSRAFEGDDGKFEMTIKPALETGATLILQIEVNGAKTEAREGVTHPLLAAAAVAGAIQIRDAGGTLFRSGGSSSSQGNGKMTARLRYSPVNSSPGDKGKAPTMPLKLVFDAPLDVVQTQVPFSFEDVPLP